MSALKNLKLCHFAAVPGVPSDTPPAAAGGGRVRQVHPGQADEDPPRGGALQPGRDRREEGGHQTEREGRSVDPGPGHGQHRAAPGPRVRGERGRQPVHPQGVPQDGL